MNTETTSLFIAIVKVVGSLGLVIGIMLLVAFLLKKLGLAGHGPRAGSLIKVLETRMLAPKKFVAVLEIAGQHLVVGVTDHQVNLLARLEATEELARQTGQEPPGPGAGGETLFAGLIRKAMLAAGGKDGSSHRDSKDTGGNG